MDMRKLRLMARVSQKEAAEIINVSQAALSDKEVNPKRKFTPEQEKILYSHYFDKINSLFDIFQLAAIQRIDDIDKRLNQEQKRELAVRLFNLTEEFIKNV